MTTCIYIALTHQNKFSAFLQVIRFNSFFKSVYFKLTRPKHPS